MTGTDEELLKLRPVELVAIIRRLEKRIEEQDRRIKQLEDQLRESKHSGKAQFGKARRVSKPKRPGRRPGKGRFERRQEPQPTKDDCVTETRVRLDPEDKRCRKCGCPLKVRRERASTVDVPAQPPRVINLFEVEVGECGCCGERIRARHPGLRPSQSGANAHQVGPNVLAQGLALHYHRGLPLRKVPGVLRDLTGIKITQSALTQAATSLCQKGGLLDEHYNALRAEVASSPVVNTDDTGWRINATLAFLMGFFTDNVAFYQIRDRHRHQEVLEVLGQDFDGMLGTDRGTNYEAKAMEEMAMQKCLSHVLKNLSEVKHGKRGRAKHWITTLQNTLREGLDRWKEWESGKITIRTYLRHGRRIERMLQRLLRHRWLKDADNQRLLNGLGLQMDRGRLTLFLRYPEIEPTNNRAERGLRPAVIARKVSHCSKNSRGAHTYEVMKSIFTTLSLRTTNVVQSFALLLQGANLPRPAPG